MTLETVSEVRAHGGVQGVYRHASAATHTDMTFSLFMPPQPEKGESIPLIWYLSGLTCTHANVTDKGEYRAACAKAGIIFLPPTPSRVVPTCPTMPRAWDFGLARASMSIDAVPWSRPYRMASYITKELPALVADRSRSTVDREFGIDGRQAPLTLALTIPGISSVSASRRASRRGNAVGKRRLATISAG